jgi:hypothetical protein
VDDQVEAAVGEHGQVGHVALDVLDREPLPVGDEPVLRELIRAVVEDRDVRPGGGQDRPLLPPAAGETQHVDASQ